MDWIFFSIVVAVGSAVGTYLGNVAYNKKQKAKVVINVSKDWTTPGINQAQVVDPVNPLDKIDLDE